MITPRTRTDVSAVSLATALIAMLALGACARGPSPVTRDDPAAQPVDRVPLRFDNDAQTYVDVYFVTTQQQWRLGRVSPGATTTLWIPGTALRSTSAFVRLVVLAASPLSIDAAGDPNATITIAQPVAELVSQHWTFSHRQLATAQILGAPIDIRHP